jgi:aminoacrylate hydrolase
VSIPTQGHALHLPGCRLFYSVRGSGDSILFIQGAGVHGDAWLPQVDELSAERRCLWFDNRGTGRSPIGSARISVDSMARDALAVLDAEALSPTHIVGHSLGGQIAIQLALLEPLRVRSLALLCSFADGRELSHGQRMIWLGLRSRIGSARMRRRAFLQIVLPPRPISDSELDALAIRLAPLYGHDLATQPSVLLAQIAAFRHCDLRSRLGELGGIPTLVVAAKHDLIVPPSLGRALASGIPGAQYLEVEDAGHSLPITHAGRVNALLREHFAASRDRIGR